MATTRRQFSPAAAPGPTISVDRLSVAARLLLAILRLHVNPTDHSPTVLMQLSCLSWILGAGCKRQVMLTCLRDIVDATILWPPFGLQLNNLASPTLADDEVSLLQYFDALLNERADRRVFHLPERPRLEPLIAALCLVRDHGFRGNNRNHLFQVRSLKYVPAGLTEQAARTDLRDTLLTDELSTDEAYLLYTVRLWPIAQENGEDGQWVLMQMHAHLGTLRVAAFTDALLHAIRHSGKCALGTACFCQPTLTADEARLLATFAAFQHHQPRDAERFARDWLAPHIVHALGSQGGWKLRRADHSTRLAWSNWATMTTWRRCTGAMRAFHDYVRGERGIVPADGYVSSYGMLRRTEERHKIKKRQDAEQDDALGGG